MALNPQQLAMARLIMGIGARRGLSPLHQRELAAASYAESSLNPSAVNKSSGAAGLFQLLSSGYRNRANQLGGLSNPRANTLAIINDYVNYWRQHPNAAPGEAGRDVERSGEGADFYSRNLSLIPGGGAGVPQGTTRAGAPSPVSGPGFQPSQSAGFESAIVNALRNRGSGQSSLGNLVRAFTTAQAKQVAQAQAHMPTSKVPANPSDAQTQTGGTLPYVPTGKAGGRGLAEAFYDPLGSYDNGQFGGPIGHHMDHVHLSITNPQTMLGAISYAQQHGLRVGENPYVDPVDPVHVKGSFHYRDFPGLYNKRKLGEAIDVSGDAAAMASYYRWATRNLR